MVIDGSSIERKRTTKKTVAELGLKKKKYHEAQKKVLEMYLAGEKISIISEKLNVSAGFIHKEIKAAGLKPRKKL